MQSITHICLDEHIHLYHIPDAKYKTTTVSAYLHRPLCREEVTKNALLAQVLRRGTKKLSGMAEINRYTEDLYGTRYNVSAAKKGNVQSLVSSISVLSDTYTDRPVLADAVGLMLDFLFSPRTVEGVFDPAYVEIEKKNLKDAIEALVNDKRSYATYRCISEMCADEPAALFEFGYVEDLDTISPQSLYAHYQSIITKSPLTIFAIGDADVDALCDAVRTALKDRNFAITPLKYTPEKKQAGEIKMVEEAFDVAQGKLSLGLRTCTTALDPDYYALVVANSIFGAGAHSKLFNNVREKLSLCYYASSALDKFNPIMIVSSGIEFENFKKAKKEILFQLEATKKGAFTDEELAIAKEYIINQYRSYLDSPHLMRDYYLGCALFGLSDTIDDAINKIKAVTTEDVVRAFTKVKLDTVYFLKGKEDTHAVS